MSQGKKPKPPRAKPRRSRAQTEALKDHAIKPGEVRNPQGMNGWRKAQARIAEFMAAVSVGDKDKTRFERVLQATFLSALVVGIKGAADRKLLIEQVAGRAKQHMDLSSEDGSMSPGGSAASKTTSELREAVAKGLRLCFAQPQATKAEEKGDAVPPASADKPRGAE